jgi:V8-like Glu-specific endopeptidase
MAWPAMLLAATAAGGGARTMSDAELLSTLAARGARASSQAVSQKGAEGEEKTAIPELSTDALIHELRAREKVIYGVDGRLDLYQVTEARQLEKSTSVAALVRNNRLQQGADGRWSLMPAATLSSAKGVCRQEAFADQPVVAFCSSFLIAPRVLVTAGHCVKNAAALAGFKAVFGYAMRNRSSLEPIAADAVYSAVKLRGRLEEEDGADWAVLELDRDVKGRAPLPLRNRGLVPIREPLYVIGFPAGLPMKVAGGAEVRDNQPADFFVANLDSYGGNSGSPVFSEISGEVEGVLVRGETDFIYSPERKCMESKVCPTTGCRGEDVTRIAAVPGELLR